MLVDGFNHVAVLTADTGRLVAFYREMFGAIVEGTVHQTGGLCLTIVRLGTRAKLNVFEIVGNDQANRRAPMFNRGRLDHLGLQATTLDSFDALRDRLVACGASDGFVTDLGDILTLWFCDPDGLEGEVCIANPDAQPGVYRPPGTPSRRHHMPPSARLG